MTKTCPYCGKRLYRIDGVLKHKYKRPYSSEHFYEEKCFDESLSKMDRNLRKRRVPIIDPVTGRRIGSKEKLYLFEATSYNPKMDTSVSVVIVAPSKDEAREMFENYARFGDVITIKKDSFSNYQSIPYSRGVY
jgi:hypothetical protein